MKQNDFSFIPLIKRGIFPLQILVGLRLVSAKDCSLTNLGSCLGGIINGVMSSLINDLPNKFFQFLLGILNSPIIFLLNLIKQLMVEPINLSVFASTWAIIIYIISFFYGLIILFNGFQFVVGGDSPEKRENAKASLARTVIMIILVQLSYYIYQLINDIFAAITKVFFNLVDQSFFTITAGNITNTALQFVFVIPYLIILVLFLIVLTLRYIFVASGVLFFVIGIFFYFISPLKEFGSMLINILIAAISLPLFYSLVFLASSKILNVGIFASFKILVALGAFGLVTLLTILLSLFIIIKSALKAIMPVVKVVKSVQGFI